MKWAEEYGAWTFKNRSWLPVPLAAGVLLLSRHIHPVHRLMVSGVALETVGESIRFWAIRHIGGISRTRAARVGPLKMSGPYAHVRNPLYVGNWCLWTGVVVLSGVLWMLPMVWALFGLEYAFMIAHEERLLRTHHTDYDDYARRVPRWLPRPWQTAEPPPRVPLVPWSAVFFSERSTLAAIVIIVGLLLSRG